MASFELRGGQYQRFPFGTFGGFVEIQVDVTHMSTVNVILMSDRQFHIYAGLEAGTPEYQDYWPEVSHLHKLVAIDAGQWSLIIESRGLPSRGRASVRQIYPR